MGASGARVNQRDTYGELGLRHWDVEPGTWVGRMWHGGGARHAELRGPGRGQGTCDEGRHTPAQHVVEAHRASVDVAHLRERSVQVQGLQQSPGEGAEEQEVQQDGDDCASELRPQARSGTGRGAPRTWSLLSSGRGGGPGCREVLRGSLSQRKALLGCWGSKGHWRRGKHRLSVSYCCRSRG